MRRSRVLLPSVAYCYASIANYTVYGFEGEVCPLDPAMSSG